MTEYSGHISDGGEKGLRQVNPVAREGLLQGDDLHSIAERALEQAASARQDKQKLPIWLTVRESEDQRYKVRIYPSAQQAARQQEALAAIRGIAASLPLLGRVDQVLIFEHLESASFEEVGILRAARDIGAFLGRISRQQIPHYSADELDAELAAWVEEFEQMGFVSNTAAEHVRRRYLQLRPTDSELGMDYWDAMPHNFGWRDSKLVLFDEKHLRTSFIGVGLIKPSFFLDASSFSAMLTAFADTAQGDAYAQHRKFLELYYSCAALHYYVQQIGQGVLRVRANPRMRFYRGLLMRRCIDARLGRILESLRFSMRHPLETVVFLAVKSVHRTTWQKLLEMIRLRRLDWGLDEP
jgi:hypothetical protein